MVEVSFELVDTHAAWSRTLKRLMQAPRMAVDIEANSLYAYREQICLIQISTDESNYIIDPLCGISLEPLGELFNSPDAEKVFHAAEYDLSLMYNLYDWNVVNLFDTMWAGRLLGFSKMGLAWFLETMYGVELNKKHQKANWAQRPLTRDRLIYACNDTCHLLRMRDDLGKELDAKGLAAEAVEVFLDVCRPHVAKREFDPDGFWKLPGVRTMPGNVQAVLKALFIFRDNEAKRRDVPPFKVINNHMLLELARASARWNGKVPKTLGPIPGISDKILDRFSHQLLPIIRKALHSPAPEYPTHTHRHSAGYWQRHEALMQWRKEVAAKRGVESDVILSRTAIEEIADKAPRTDDELAAIASMGPWRRKQYGASILTLLDQ